MKLSLEDIITDRGGEMSSSLDVQQLLVDHLQVLSAALTGTEHRDTLVTSLVSSCCLCTRTHMFQ